jgi:hypothetical protein
MLVPEENINEEEHFIQIINETYQKYFKHGPRSNKKVDYFHSEIQKLLREKYFHKDNGYNIELEYSVQSFNSSGKKDCDIVILKDGKLHIIMPVKIIMTNFKQNKNNYWESFTGEASHLKWKNPNVIIIPINIFMNKTPYLKKDKKITKFEDITMDDILNYNELITHNLCYDVINYIVEVDHLKKENEYFDEIAPIKKLNTQYRSFALIFKDLL